MKQKELTLEYYLGSMVGEYIVTNFLPTLSTDMIKSNNIMEVSEEDTKEHDRLSDLWSNSKKDFNGYNDKWNDHLKNMYHLTGKYLPHELKMRIPKFGLHLVKDMEMLKEGISVSLWDCDMCSYNIDHENIVITETERKYTWCDYITLKLDEKYIKESLVK